jgi:hypothetical protein
MLSGERVVLRPIRDVDLPAFIVAHVDICNRGAYFPLGVLSEPVLRRRFADTEGARHPVAMLALVSVTTSRPFDVKRLSAR